MCLKLKWLPCPPQSQPCRKCKKGLGERIKNTMTTVRVNNGRVEEYENGSIRRTFGSNIATVVAVTRAGRVETYVNGSIRQTFGSNAVSAQVSGDTVAVQTSNGRTEEYVNGSIRRTY